MSPDHAADIDSPPHCHLCGAEGELYWSCCAGPEDGSSGSGVCDHEEEGGSPTCGPCGAAEGWWQHGS